MQTKWQDREKHRVTRMKLYQRGKRIETAKIPEKHPRLSQLSEKSGINRGSRIIRAIQRIARILRGNEERLAGTEACRRNQTRRTNNIGRIQFARSEVGTGGGRFSRFPETSDYADHRIHPAGGAESRKRVTMKIQTTSA